MKSSFRPYRFPPLQQFSTAPGQQRPADADGQWQAALAEGFEQGRRDGYEQGLARGEQDGYASGRGDGLAQGRKEGKQEVLADFEGMAKPLDAVLDSLRALRADYRAAQRKEVVELVAKVARQVIRAELALQPVQLLSLVDETLALMPPARDGIDVFLNPEELARIQELDPKRAKRWNLIADARLEAGECRIRAGDNEVDAGCHQRLTACMEQVSNHLAAAAEQSEREDELGLPARSAPAAAPSAMAAPAAARPRAEPKPEPEPEPEPVAPSAPAASETQAMPAPAMEAAPAMEPAPAPEAAPSTAPERKAGRKPAAANEAPPAEAAPVLAEATRPKAPRARAKRSGALEEAA